MSRSGGDWVPEPTFQADNLALLPARGARVRIVDVAVWLSLEMRAGLSVYNIPLASRRELEARWHADSRRTPPRPTPGFLETYEMGRPLLVAIGAVDNQSALVAILPEHRCALAVLTNAPPPATQALLRDLLVNFIEMSEAADQADVDEPTVEEVALPETD
jgi:CubicO group peptidase (beta-lactamase class C family)